MRRQTAVLLMLTACVPAVDGVPEPDAGHDAGVDAGTHDSGTDAGGDAGPVGDGGTLDLNDVSFLFPLPPPTDLGLLMPLTGVMSKARFDELPPMFEGVPRNGVYDMMRVLAARVDHCFPDGAGHCRRQLRLVAQPTNTTTVGGGIVTTSDVAIHLFYDLDEATFAALLADLRALQTQADGLTRGAPLGVHPTMRQQGLAGPYAVALKALISRYATEARFTQVASSVLGGFGTLWEFQMQGLDAGHLSLRPIAKLGALERQTFREIGTPMERRGSLEPGPPGTKLGVLIDVDALADAGVAELTAALRETRELENPAHSDPAKNDCASCHVASRARKNAETARGVSSDEMAERYRNPRHDLTWADAKGDDPRVVRVFGYFDALPAFLPRVVHESAEVADALNAMP